MGYGGSLLLFHYRCSRFEGRIYLDGKVDSFIFIDQAEVVMPVISDGTMA